MGEWRAARLGDVIQLQRGFDLPSASRRPGPVPIVSSGGTSGYHDEAPVQAPGVVTGRYGTLGRVFYLAEPFWPLNTTLFVRDFKGNDPRFVSYLLKTVDFLAYSDKAAVPGVNRNHLHEAMVPLAPLAEQRRIAEILGALDDKIELNRRMSETLETTARELFQSWFARSDPTGDGSDGGPTHGTLLDVAQLLSGGTPKTDRPDYWGGGILWASAKDVSQCLGPFLIDTERQITGQGLAESPTQLIPALSTVVVARGATTGRQAILGEAMAMNQTCYALVTRDGTPFWLYLQLQDVMGDLVNSAHGSVFDTITTATFASATFPLPSEPRRRAFEHVAAPHFWRLLACTREMATLSALRDALLPRLISGELRIGDAEPAVETAPA